METEIEKIIGSCKRLGYEKTDVTHDYENDGLIYATFTKGDTKMVIALGPKEAMDRENG